METLFLNQHVLLVLASATALPALAVIAVILRRGFFTGKWKMLFLSLGLCLLLYTIFATLEEYGDTLGWKDIVVGGITAIITMYILSRFNHGHKHDIKLEGARGLVVSEAFHSLVDGAVIGATYLINPLLGYAATLGILTHELPKILGTLAVLRSLGLSIQKTIFYGMFAQIGSPIAAVLVYLLGKQIDHEQFKLLEIASISSLTAIVFWIIYLEWSFHKRHPHQNDSHKSTETTNQREIK